MLKILRSKSRRKFVFTLCWPWLGDAFARSKCSHHGTCFINWIKENFTVLKRKLKLNPKSAWNIEFQHCALHLVCAWWKHIQLEPARIMSYKSNQIISDWFEANIEAQTKFWTKHYWTFWCVSVLHEKRGHKYQSDGNFDVPHRTRRFLFTSSCPLLQ